MFARSPERSGGPRKESEGADDSNYEPNVTFEPVVPLPDLVEVQTGEENEKVNFVTLQCYGECTSKTRRIVLLGYP